jgi:predicted Rossmann-fold nucleotide-binding protein
MAAVSRAFAQVPNRKGLVLGVVPCASEDEPTVPKRIYPNEWVEVPIYTHLYLSGPHGADVRSRNHIVVLAANVVVALPGGPGTASEVQLAFRYKKPVIAFLKARAELAELPAGVRWESDLGRVKTFITEEIAKRR